MGEADKILIMGPGRCGSTFLWKLFQNLGFDTGPHPEFLRWKDTIVKVSAGEQVKYPTVIKHLGGFCMDLNGHIQRNDWKVEHIFFCLRDTSFDEFREKWEDTVKF